MIEKKEIHLLFGIIGQLKSLIEYSGRRSDSSEFTDHYCHVAIQFSHVLIYKAWEIWEKGLNETKKRTRFKFSQYEKHLIEVANKFRNEYCAHYDLDCFFKKGDIVEAHTTHLTIWGVTKVLEGFIRLWKAAHNDERGIGFIVCNRKIVIYKNNKLDDDVITG